MTDAPTIRTPAWAGRLRLLGFCLGVTSFVAWMVEVMEGGHELAGVVRNATALPCAVLFVIIAAHWWLTMRSYRRSVAALAGATPPAEIARRQARFIEELTRNAADCHVGEWPFSGSDVLNDMARHGVIDQAATDTAVEAARARLGEQFDIDPEHPRPGHQLHQGFDKALDDEIPF
jgi:hypothetical protein